MREKLVSQTSTGANEVISGLATSLCKEGIAAYGSGDLRTSGRALLTLINNYSPSFSNGIEQAYEAYVTLARTQVKLMNPDQLASISFVEFDLL